MLGKSKNYVLQLQAITSEQFQLVGREAVSVAALSQFTPNLPDTFVITADAFDDFVSAAGLLDFINQQLAQVQPGDVNAAQIVSENIANAIEQASYPDIVLKPLAYAYKEMSGFTDKYVALKPSWSLDINLTPFNSDAATQLNVKGEAMLLYKVKQVWKTLFSPEALLLRANANYTDDIAISVVVQKMVQAEVSGKAYSVDPVTGDEQFMEVEAVLGLGNVLEHTEVQPDIFKLDNTDLRVVEKNIFSQQYMYVRKGRTKANEDPNIKVPISQEWQRTQKLADSKLQEVAELLRDLRSQYDHELEIQWAYETGELYILSIAELKPFKQVNEQKLLKVRKSKSTAHTITEQNQKTTDINALAAEVNELAAQLEREPDVQKENISEQTIKEILTIDDIDLQEASSQEPIHKEFDLISDVYLDVSDMSTDKLTVAAKFDGVFFDATQMLLRHHLLPETIVENKAQYAALVEAYALELGTLAKLIDPKPIYYMFSDIGDSQRANLDGEMPAQDQLDGAERFILEPRALSVEVAAIRRARQSLGVKNLKIILPKLRSSDELTALKKQLSQEKVRRSGVLQLFAEVATAAFAHELEDVKAAELDGYMINLAKFTQNIVQRDRLRKSDYKPALASLKLMSDYNRHKKLESLLLTEPNLELIKQIFDSGLPLQGFVFTENVSDDTLHELKQLESSSSLANLSKRGPGRPRKGLR